MCAVRRERRRIDGVLLLDKPVGLSSNAALQRAKRALNALKAGHTGTLDPLASGLLPLCFGEATKFAQYLIDADKTYLARLRLGETTATFDAEGPVIESRPIECGVADFLAALPRFEGDIEQLPPMHSALKHQGRALYDYARAGVEVARQPRRVHVASIRLLEWAPPYADIEVHCGKGTYIRSLAHDLGEVLACGAHLAALRRTATGGFDLSDAIALETLEAMPQEEADALLKPPQTLVASLPAIELSDEESWRLTHGQSVAREECGLFRVHDPQGRFLGLALAQDGLLHASRLMAELPA